MNKAVITVREYREADRPFLRTLYLAARKAGWQWLDSQHWQLEDFDHSVLGEKVLVAEYQGHIAGFASLLVADSFLHNLFIDPASQNQGVASALLEACYPLCRKKMLLKCLTRNLHALAFYQRRDWLVISSGLSEKGDYFLMQAPDR